MEKRLIKLIIYIYIYIYIYIISNSMISIYFSYKKNIYFC